MSGVDVDAIAVELETFLRRNFHIAVDDPGFTRRVNLWDEGYVDSAGVVETVAFIEGRWHITLPEQVLFDPSFTHVDGMAALIAGVLRGNPA